MNNITKIIVCGLSALALYACSSDNASAPEQTVSQAPGNNVEQRHVRIDPPDETDSIPESWLEGYTLSKMIMVDHWCVESPEHPDNPMWCLPPRVQLESGTVTNMYWGTSDRISCELAEDTLTYSELLSMDDSTVSKKLSRSATELITDIAEAFRDSCEAEGGTFIDTNEDALECEVKTKPLECEGCPVNLGRVYTDPYWRPFAEMVISPCRIRPQIEPIE
jgi:hypothetical protein